MGEQLQLLRSLQYGSSSQAKHQPFIRQEHSVPDSAAEEAKIAAAVTAVDGEVDWKSTPFSGHKFYWLNIEEDEDNAPLTELSYTNYHKSQPNRASEACVSAACSWKPVV